MVFWHICDCFLYFSPASSPLILLQLYIFFMQVHSIPSVNSAKVCEEVSDLFSYFCIHLVHLCCHHPTSCNKYDVNRAFVATSVESKGWICHKYVGRSEGTAPNILNLGTRLLCVMRLTICILYLHAKNPQYSLNRRMGGLQSQSGCGGKKEILATDRCHINFQCLMQSVWMKFLTLTCRCCVSSACCRSGPWNFGPMRAV